MIQTSPRFVVLDSWRGVCACMVALLHFMANSHIYPIPVIKSAGIFVDFFFVLSGFVIFANYQDRLSRGFGFIKFMFLRFGRLYPLHLATLMAFIAVDLLQMAIPSLQNFAKFSPFSAPGETFSDIVSQLFLFHALDFEKVKAFNAPSWSISAEFYTYAVFAAALILFKNDIWRFCVLSVVFLTITLTWGLIHYPILELWEGFLTCLLGFALGALCWMIWPTANNLSSRLNVPFFWSVLEISLLFAIYWFVVFFIETPVRYCAAFLFFIVLIVYSFEKGVVSSLMRRPFFVLLGVLSYSIYMNHVFIGAKIFPISMTLIENYTGFAIFTIAEGKEKLGVAKWHGDIISVFYMFIVISASMVTYWGIEKPLRNLSRRLVTGKKINQPEGTLVPNMPEAQ